MLWVYRAVCVVPPTGLPATSVTYPPANPMPASLRRLRSPPHPPVSVFSSRNAFHSKMLCGSMMPQLVSFSSSGGIIHPVRCEASVGVAQASTATSNPTADVERQEADDHAGQTGEQERAPPPVVHEGDRHHRREHVDDADPDRRGERGGRAPEPGRLEDLGCVVDDRVDSGHLLEYRKANPDEERRAELRRRQVSQRRRPVLGDVGPDPPPPG